MHPERENCLVLLSAGLDSLVSLAVAMRQLDVVCGVTFNYGQRAARAELESARRICLHYKIEFLPIDITWLGAVSSSAVTTKGRIGIKRFQSVKDVWVPNRNGLFLSIGAALAEARRIKYVITGFNREEAEDFLDNSRKFVNLFNRILNFSTLNRVRVKSFVQDLNKMQIVKLGMRLKIPWELIYSCYLGKARMCGRCLSCLRLKDALKQSGLLIELKKLFDK